MTEFVIPISVSGINHTGLTVRGSLEQQAASYTDMIWCAREEYQTKRNAELAESWAIRFKVWS